MNLSRAEKLIQSAVQAHGRRGPNVHGEYSTCCPFCRLRTGDDDRKYKLQLNPSKGVYHCYKCAAGSKADITSILELAAEELMAAPDPEAKVVEPMPEEAVLLDPKALSHRPFTEYLQRRNLLDESVQADAMVCTRGYYAGRILIPHISAREIPGTRQRPGTAYAGFSARAIHKGVEPKYLHAKGMDRRGTVWGMHLPWRSTMYVVEGVFDAMALYGEAVATFGKNVTHEQMDLLEGMRRTGTDIIVCLDGDAWEECAALAMQLTLRGMRDVRWCRLPPGMDPGVLKGAVRNFIVTP